MRAFGSRSEGGVLIVFGLMLPILLGLSAAALEYGSLVKRRGELQRAADSGSIAGVNQFKLANADDAAAILAAVSMARAQAQAEAPAGRATEAAATVLNNHSAVQVTLTETVPLSLGKLLQISEVTVSVTSTAKLSGTTRLCLLALDPTNVGAFHLEASARITATDCSLYSNSKSASGIQGGNASMASALSICSAGGFSGSKANFTPPPATDCPALIDPLADRAVPSPGPCVSVPLYMNPKLLVDGIDSPLYGSNVVSAPSVTLDPGTYCGGLHITKGAQVKLRPGIYIIKDGPLVVDKNASLTGANTGFFFTGIRGGLLFDQGSVISLTAPKDGLLAGLLFFEDRSLLSVLPLPPPLSLKGRAPFLAGAIGLREYRIISDEARTLLGTIYLPRGRLIIDSKKPIADQSAYTVIIARFITLYDGPNLILNARYGSTDIPVPKGVGPSSADTVLSH
ncbi:hypothetical protein ACFQ4G_06385 [Methylobacterium marchantiae]|uniref:Putative Flp pilus-assembly TadG-like N-terminal domain-containing protein n=1 Tax=Methylobacterium marchantiae TaxID=600331 RepID=A0ABW3WY90_9HYPH